jgi:hypothetical protein
MPLRVLDDESLPLKKKSLNRKSFSKHGCVSHCGLAVYITKYLKAKEEVWKLKYITKQKYNLQKIL